MLKYNQELIDQFNREERRRQWFQHRKLKRHIEFPELGEYYHGILDLLDEIIEKKRQTDCISKIWID